MRFYHDRDNAASYAAMAEGYDASEQLEALYEVLPEASTVLELGSGPGNDLHLLAQRYQTTGSDYSPAFVDILKERFPDRRVLTLDAVSIATEGLFDAIFSNKVLQHLTDDELKASFCRQGELLSPGGYVLHLVWQHLVPPEEGHGLIYQARDAGAMMAAMGSTFEMIKVTEFCEFDDGDSIAILARKVRNVS